jgi:hypothetical protein
MPSEREGERERKNALRDLIDKIKQSRFIDCLLNFFFAFAWTFLRENSSKLDFNGHFEFEFFYRSFSKKLTQAKIR